MLYEALVVPRSQLWKHTVSHESVASPPSERARGTTSSVCGLWSRGVHTGRKLDSVASEAPDASRSNDRTIATDEGAEDEDPTAPLHSCV